MSNKYVTSGHERPNRKVFRRCLETQNDGADVTSDGSLFHWFAAETGKTRLPTAVIKVFVH